MTDALAAFIRGHQTAFRQRLRPLREAQLARAEERARQAAVEWQAYLDYWRRRHAEAEALMCPSCGTERQAGCCEAKVSQRTLVRMIRRLAGINHGHAARADEWSDWGRGKDGPRACGPHAWDNAVRAYEEK